MQRNNWDDFYQSGSVSDYLKYRESVKNTSGSCGDYPNRDSFTDGVESVRYAEKSDGNGAFGNTGW